MRRPRLLKEAYDRLSPQERDEMVVPATYFPERLQGGKKWYVSMLTRENGRTFDTPISKGFLTREKAEKEAQKLQDKENASVERTKAEFAKFEAMDAAAAQSAK